MTTANLAIQDNDTVIQFTSAGETDFEADFPILSKDEVKVSVDQVDQTLGVHYNIADADLGQAGGFTVSFVSATTAGQLISIWQDMPIKRTTGFPTGASVITGEALNTEFARQVRQDQQLRRDIGRALRIPADDPDGGQNMEIPTLTSRKGMFLAFDATSGEPIPSTGTGADAGLRADLASTVGGLLGVVEGEILKYRKTTQENNAGVTIADYSIKSHEASTYIDPRRYNTSVGTAANDLASVNSAISVMKELGGGLIVIPPEYSASMVLPSLGLSSGQWGAIQDLRMDVSGEFGAIVWTIEARDIATGAYASEQILKGRQNPGYVLQPLSDGTAPGYPIPNFAVSFVGRTNTGGNNFQLLVDPYFKAYRGDFSLIGFPGGSSSEAVYVGADANNKHRWNFQTNRFNSVAGTITASTNATPIVVTLSANHNIPSGQYCSVGISGTGITGLNGSWKAQSTGVNQLTLLNSTAPGATASAGTCTYYPRTMRAVINIPAVQGGTEALALEGTNAVFTTTAGVGWVLYDTSNTLIGGLSYNTGPIGMRATGIKGISQSNTVANNLAGTDTFAAATTKVVTFANNETNANYRVQITWTSDPGAAVTRWWVSGKGQTGFTVNVNAATSAPFDWVIIRD